MSKTKNLNTDQVCKITGLSRTTLSTRLDPESKYHDPTFPKPFKNGPRINAWTSESISNWLNSQQIVTPSPKIIPKVHIRKNQDVIILAQRGKEVTHTILLDAKNRIAVREALK